MAHRPRFVAAALGAAALTLVSCADAPDQSATGGHDPVSSGSAAMSHGRDQDAPGGANLGTTVPIPPTADHNAQDVRFAQEMILHHQQAIDMADLAPTRASDARVTDLAARIKVAQAPEIDQLTAWLHSWGQPVPDTSVGHMDMPSMMSADDMAHLESQTGAAFDRTFLEQMIRHHEGAVEMARTESAKGKFADTTAMAASIVATQSAEIDEMRGLLG
jgi:uncharacterized protein (DUF305 family)